MYYEFRNNNVKELQILEATEAMCIKVICSLFSFECKRENLCGCEARARVLFY